LLDVDPKSLPTNRKRKDLRSLLTRLAKLSEAGDDWRPDYRYADGWAFEPIWARDYTAAWLWGECEKVVLLSATLRPVAAEEELGLRGEEYEFYETASPYPPERRPIIHVKTARVNHKMSDIARERWIGRVDEILETRQDRRGIIHTVSFDRAKQLLSRSRFAKNMFVPSGGADTATLVKRYRDTEGGILVSPSVHTGHDFVGEAARYQIIVKVPYPDTRFGLAAARAAEDEDWARRQAATTLVQMSGRIVRGPSDWGESLVIDDNILDLYTRHKYLFPQWFRSAFRSQVEIPEPLSAEIV
jgi:Rad3-related DNA helicase